MHSPCEPGAGRQPTPRLDRAIYENPIFTCMSIKNQARGRGHRRDALLQAGAVAPPRPRRRDGLQGDPRSRSTTPVSRCRISTASRSTRARATQPRWPRCSACPRCASRRRSRRVVVGARARSVRGGGGPRRHGGGVRVGDDAPAVNTSTRWTQVEGGGGGSGGGGGNPTAPAASHRRWAFTTNSGFAVARSQLLVAHATAHAPVRHRRGNTSPRSRSRSATMPIPSADVVAEGAAHPRRLLRPRG